MLPNRSATYKKALGGSSLPSSVRNRRSNSNWLILVARKVEDGLAVQLELIVRQCPLNALASASRDDIRGGASERGR
jgi:hypothetical protein